MPEKQESEPEEKRTIVFQPVDLRISISLLRQDRVESCCNYDITGRSGNVLLVLPPMTHIQDMPR